MPLKAAKRYLRRRRMRRMGVDVQLCIDCLSVERRHDGWVVHPDVLGPGAIVYSFGVGSSIEWDQAMIDRFGAEVHGFDPTPKAVEWMQSQNLPAGFTFHSFGVADVDGAIDFYPPRRRASFNYSPVDRGLRSDREGAVKAPVHRLSTILRMLGHDHIDVLKIDIEGGEYAVIRDLLDSKIDARQLLIEFHHNYPAIPASHTVDAVKALNASGYRIFHISDRGYEVSFIRR